MVYTPLSHANITVNLLLCVGVMHNDLCETTQNVKSCMALTKSGQACTNASLQLTLTEAQPAYSSSMQLISCNQSSKHSDKDIACNGVKPFRDKDGTMHHCISVSHHVCSIA